MESHGRRACAAALQSSAVIGRSSCRFSARTIRAVDPPPAESKPELPPLSLPSLQLNDLASGQGAEIISRQSLEDDLEAQSNSPSNSGSPTLHPQKLHIPF